jgi:hypothetical protein
MSYTYDPLDLVPTTSTGRLNIVRLLVGDNNTEDPQLQDEEVYFALAQNNNNVYFSASFCARLVASKYARMVNTQLDGALEAEYSDRVKQYTLLAIQMTEMAKKMSGKNLGVAGGGISNIAIAINENNTDRPKPAFKTGQFDNDSSE